MILGNPFGYSNFFGYPGYDYYEQEPDFGYRQSFENPRFVRLSPMQQRYSMPVEIPVVHDRPSRNSKSTTDKSMTEAKRRMNLEEGGRGQSCACVEERKQSPLKHHQQTHASRQRPQSSKTNTVRQDPVNEVDSDVYDSEEDNVQFHPTSSYSDIFPGVFPFAGRVPFPQKSFRSAPSCVPPKKNPSQKLATAANVKTNVTNRPTGNVTSQETDSRESAATDKKPFHKLPADHTVTECRPETVEVSEEEFTSSPPQPSECSLSSVEQLENIRKEMESIEEKVENFCGEKKDKEYIFLDESMTSLLLRLDTVESHGIEEIRNKRRQLVRLVQEYVKKLESKVGITATEGMEAEEIEDGGNERTSEAEKDMDLSVDVVATVPQNELEEVREDDRTLTEDRSDEPSKSDKVEEDKS